MESKSRAGVNWLVAVFAGTLTSLTIGDALGVEPRLYQLENGGAIAPHLQVDIGQDSNPLRAESGSEASVFVRVKPTIRYILRRRNNELAFGYSGEYFQYFSQYCSDPVTAGFFSVSRPGDCLTDSSPEFDKASFQNHEIELTGFLEINRRARANLRVASALDSQPLGTGLSSVNSVLTAVEKPDSFRRNTARLTFSYGANQARGELRFGLNLRDRNFRENAGRELAELDERRVEPSVQLLYRIGSRTQIFAGFSQGNINGGNAERALSSQSVGLEFDASAITSGTVTLSAVSEDFDDPSRDDISFAGFELDLTWKPRRYSTVTFTGSRETERATLSEAVGITTNLDVNWRHYWRDRFSTLLVVGLSRNDAEDGIGFDDANDRTNSFRIVGNYNVVRWLDVGAFVQTQKRVGVNINEESRDFTRTLVGLTANGTF